MRHILQLEFPAGVVSSVEQKEKSKGNEENAKRVADYKKKVEEELNGICDKILA
jgi:14-3-3 protein epsilon